MNNAEIKTGLTNVMESIQDAFSIWIKKQTPQYIKETVRRELDKDSAEVGPIPPWWYWEGRELQPVTGGDITDVSKSEVGERGVTPTLSIHLKDAVPFEPERSTSTRLRRGRSDSSSEQCAGKDAHEKRSIRSMQASPLHPDHHVGMHGRPRDCAPVRSAGFTTDTFRGLALRRIVHGVGDGQRSHRGCSSQLRPDRGHPVEETRSFLS